MGGDFVHPYTLNSVPEVNWEMLREIVRPAPHNSSRHPFDPSSFYDHGGWGITWGAFERKKGEK